MCRSHLHAGDNAGRCGAVYGTKVVAPGSAAAADIEQCLTQLSEARAPVLDLRRLQHTPVAPRQQQQQQCGSTTVAASATSSSGHSHHHRPQQPRPQQQQPEQDALCVAQAAASKIVAARLQQEQQQADSSADDADSKAEVLAALVEQLPQLLPALEVLVLPLLLPGGR